MERRKLAYLLAGLAAAMLVVAVLWGSWNGGEHADFWSIAIPGTLTGVGTLALAAATVAVLRGDQQDRRDREERERRAVAAAVHLEQPSMAQTTRPDPEGGPGFLEGFTWQCRLDNRSDYPIRNIKVYLIPYMISLPSTVVKPFHPAGIVCEPTSQVPAASDKIFRFDHIQWDRKELLMIVATPLVAVAFTDFNGYRWLRDHEWKLTDITQYKGSSMDLVAIRMGRETAPPEFIYPDSDERPFAT